MADIQDYEERDNLEEIPEAVKDPTPEQMRLMIEAFVKKKRAYEAANPRPPEEQPRETMVKTISPWRGTSSGRNFSSGGGRPRRRYTKTVTMVKASNDGKILRLAGRGRPKAGVERLKIDVPHDTRLSKGVEYKLVDGNLIEVK
tara:strand:- start:7615 stop:8046 length:432 start_codon:yes stop_codon:yes gene_type:complete